MRSDIKGRVLLSLFDDLVPGTGYSIRACVLQSTRHPTWTRWWTDDETRFPPGTAAHKRTTQKTGHGAYPLYSCTRCAKGKATALDMKQEQHSQNARMLAFL